MELTGQYKIPATRQEVWEALNDPEILKQSIPGCEEVEKLSETEFNAVTRTKIGPVSARFSGRIELTDLDPPRSFRINGEGTGGAAGFAKGGASVKLDEEDGGTRLTYEVSAKVGGKLAQVGQRLIDSTAKKMSDEFFANFARIAGGEAVEAAQAPEAPPREAKGAGLPTWVWWVGAAVILAGLAIVFIV